MVGLTAGHCCAHPDEVITCSDFRLSAWVKLTAVFSIQEGTVNYTKTLALTSTVRMVALATVKD